MSKVLSNRLLKVHPSVINSPQSCSVLGANICSSASNLISLVEAVERDKGQAAILSLDLFKAYDRVNIKYLCKVMKIMNFPEKFVNWIVLLHKDAKTKLLLNFISDPISVLASVRQGDPISMILFILYIEPLLLQLSRVIQGYSLKSPIIGGLRNVQQMEVKEILGNVYHRLQCFTRGGNQCNIVSISNAAKVYGLYFTANS